jgi:hypothetical protein
MRVTRDAFAVDTPRWMVGDSEFDMLDWYDHLLAQAVVLIAPYNPRTCLPGGLNNRRSLIS